MKIDIDALVNTAITLFVVVLIILGISKLFDYPAIYCGILFCFFFIAYDTYKEYADESDNEQPPKN